LVLARIKRATVNFRTEAVKKACMYRVALIVLIVLCPFMVPAQESPPMVEILSKDDTQAMFAMTEEQWLANVQGNVASRMARPIGTPESGVGMAMSTAEGDILMVRPSYGENKQNPQFIQVTVGYLDPRSALPTGAALNEAIQAAQAQMKPEYDVIGNVERISGGVSMFFISTESKPR
jgi:hypothetical protein